MNNMVPFECLVSMSGVTRKIVRYFESEMRYRNESIL